MDWVLIISACAYGEPTKCKEFSVSISSESTQVQCTMQAPVSYFKQFADEHPGWQIKKWKCEDAERYNNKQKKEKAI